MPEKSGMDAAFCVPPPVGRGTTSCPKASGAAAAANIPMKKCRSTFMLPSPVDDSSVLVPIGNLQRISVRWNHTAVSSPAKAGDPVTPGDAAEYWILSFRGNDTAELVTTSMAPLHRNPLLAPMAFLKFESFRDHNLSLPWRG